MRAKLGEMDKEALMQFVKDKGNARKKDLFEVTKFQTADAEKTKKLVQHIEANIDLARDNLTEFEAKYQKYQTEKAEAEEQIGKYEEAIAEKETELKNSNEDPTPYKTAAEAARANISAKQLTDLNLIL